MSGVAWFLWISMTLVFGSLFIIAVGIYIGMVTLSGDESVDVLRLVTGGLMIGSGVGVLGLFLSFYL